METEGDIVWMTEEELDAFRLQQLETAQRLNTLLAELCLFLIQQSNERP